jgi:hypothetical protein
VARRPRRISQGDLICQILAFLDASPGGLGSAQLRDALDKYFHPQVVVRDGGDRTFDAIVRSMLSRRQSSQSVINQGLVDYDPQTRQFQITALGLQHLVDVCR